MEAHGLIDILLVLVAAKVGAELAERIGIPAVIGEITAGLLLGPSLLDWVEVTESLALLAEVGVILLLLQVGLEMDLKEMGKVGAASMGVAITGVVLPFALGYGATRGVRQRRHHGPVHRRRAHRHLGRHHRPRLR